jgi:ubiquinone/menaquinone biosynthesis C-methylase UbiE
MDYDSLAGDYARYRKLVAAVLEELKAGSGIERRSQVLEVGCGTGNYIREIDYDVGCRCWGIDLSETMLNFARSRSNCVTFMTGDAARLDLADGIMDLVFSVDTIHHVERQAQFFREAYRVLKPGGRLCTMTHSEELIRASEFLARYFPETIEVNVARYPKMTELRAWLGQAGFSQVGEKVITQPDEITDSALYATKANSSLHLISAEAYARGLEAMERDLSEGPIRGERRYLALWAIK